MYAAVCSAYDGQFSFMPQGQPSVHPKRALYGPLLCKLRAVMITKMAKPEEVHCVYYSIVLFSNNSLLIRSFI